jgi:hypothetical protein
MVVRNVSDAAGALPPSAESPDEDAKVVETILADMDKRLAAETARRERLERRLAASEQALQTADHARRAAESERDALHRELASIEDRIEALLGPQDRALAAGLDLSGMTLLYVGGRAHQAPLLKDTVERTGAHFLHHDGGIEHSTTLLPGLVSRADVTVFPVDCVSHEAMASVKRHCRQSGKPFVPLRTSSLASLLSALSSVSRRPELVVPGWMG